MLKGLKRPPGILELLLCFTTRSSCAGTSTPDPLGAAPPDIIPLGLYMSPSSATLRTPTLGANVMAWAEAALNKIRAFEVSTEVCAVSTPVQATNDHVSNPTLGREVTSRRAARSWRIYGDAMGEWGCTCGGTCTCVDGSRL